MDHPEAPLIAEEQRDRELQYDADDADDEPGTLDKPDAKPGLFILLLTFSAGISGLLFGCGFYAHPLRIANVANSYR
jgi:SP family myo-inositol transporter-like MFS transporter 13